MNTRLSGLVLFVYALKEKWTKGKFRFFTPPIEFGLAVFSRIACLGSVVIGMCLGYSTNTLAELSTLYQDYMYIIAKGSTEVSLFGVRAHNDAR